MKSVEMMPEGSVCHVKALQGCPRFLGRITAIGITVGSQLTVIKNNRHQPMLVYGKDTLIAVNRKDCGGIFIEAVQ
ncbi:MAG: ferrous iron transport protein A [Spirochaetia bacterium]|nr:ferrous iron transport protein A [Spirochaetia bacterium]